MSNSHVISRCRAVLPDGVVNSAPILIEDGVITGVFPDGSRTLPPGAEAFDAGGLIVGPGFVDPHCHGADDAIGAKQPRRIERGHDSRQTGQSRGATVSFLAKAATRQGGRRTAIAVHQ